MPRRRSDLPDGHPAAQEKDIQFNVRLTRRQHGLVTAGAAHLGLTVSNYVRYLIENGTEQVLKGMSKAERLQALDEQYRNLWVAPKGPIPQVKTYKPGEPRPPEPVIVPAPMYWDGPKKPVQPSEPPKQAAPTQPFTLPLPPSPEPAKPATGGIPFKEIFGFDPSETDGPRAAELPDDMDDWT